MSIDLPTRTGRLAALVHDVLAVRGLALSDLAADEIGGGRVLHELGPGPQPPATTPLHLLVCTGDAVTDEGFRTAVNRVRCGGWVVLAASRRRLDRVVLAVEGLGALRVHLRQHCPPHGSAVVARKIAAVPRLHRPRTAA